MDREAAIFGTGIREMHGIAGFDMIEFSKFSSLGKRWQVQQGPKPY
jgi:hypothetical protein